MASNGATTGKRKRTFPMPEDIKRLLRKPFRPQELLAAFEAARRLGGAAVLTASAVELSLMGNEDMLARNETAVRKT